jgi:S-DNA-T family DNA segregation ATPase FtsK/SpoIIIE
MAKTRRKRKKVTYNDERIRLIIGLLFVFFSLFAVLAFTSFLFTWQDDQSLFDFSLNEILENNTVEIDNWAGKAGFIISNYFIHRWFGIASYGFILITLIIGLSFWKIKPLPIVKTVKNTLIIILLLSAFLGYFFAGKWFIPGGGHGFYVSQWLNALLGKAGTILLLLLLSFVFVVYRFRELYIYLKNRLEELKTSHFSKTVKEEEPYSDAASVNNESSQADKPAGDSVKKEELEESDEEKNSDENKNNNIEKPTVSFEVEYASDEEIVEEPNIEESAEDRAVEDELVEEQHNSPFDDNLLDVNIKYNEPQDKVANSKPDNEQDNPEDIGMEVAEGAKEELVDKTTPLERLGKYDPRLDLENYQMPPLNLLPKFDNNDTSQRVSQEELEANKLKIVETLGNYNIKIDKIMATIGPTVTLYEIIPAPGIRISKIKNLEDDIALSLAALGIRIIAPMPGKGTVGIEVPNQNPEVVSMRSVIASKKFQESDLQLPVAMGKTITNETFVIDLHKMPHLLVAGATGQGKSVGLNVILTSLLYKKHPAELKLVLVDPKKVELSLYNKLSNHFLAQVPDAEEPIITDTQKVIDTLNSLTVEMDDRYELLKEAHCRSLKEYNKKFIERRLNPEKGHRYLPYIVIVVDEYADLIMTAGKEIEMPIARLAQKARAIGIHLIIATQRPTTNIITGVIKANFPARIAFRVISGVDSKTILDGPGANQLIGRGDMLISTGAEPIRLQCAFVDTPELEEIMDHIGKQQSYPMIYELPEFQTEGSGGAGMADLEKKDALFEDAARLIVVHQQGSTSLIQRKFSIGYNRAGRIVDQLEAAGIVGPFEGSKARQVLIPDEYALEQHLSKL